MIDTSITEPMECEDCGKVCNGIQGIRGHLRSCPGRELAAVNQVDEPQEPVVERASRLVRPSNQQITLGSRLTVEGVDVVLRLQEQLRALLDQMRESLPIRRADDGYARAHNLPTHEDWFNLGRNIVRLKMAIERIIQQAHVSRDEPWTLHQLAITIRDQWVSWRKEEAYRYWQKQGKEQQDFEEVLGEFGVRDLELDWSRIIDRLRWLTSHTRATL